MAPYSLRAVLGGVSAMMSIRAREKGLQFALDVDDTLPDGLIGDAVHVRQILTNSLSSAVKFTVTLPQKIADATPIRSLRTRPRGPARRPSARPKPAYGSSMTRR